MTRPLLFRLGTLLAAWLGSVVGLVLVLPLGLIVVEWIIFPLALPKPKTG